MKNNIIYLNCYWTSRPECIGKVPQALVVSRKKGMLKCSEIFKDISEGAIIIS